MSNTLLLALLGLGIEGGRQNEVRIGPARDRGLMRLDPVVSTVMCWEGPS